MPAKLGPGEPEAALISVYDRTGVVALALALQARGTPIYATSGTHAHLVENGIAAREANRCVQLQHNVKPGGAHFGYRVGNTRGIRHGIVDCMSKFAQKVFEMIVELQGRLPSTSTLILGLRET